MIIGISIPSLIAVIGGILTYGYINDVKNRQAFVHVADDLKENVLEVRRNEKNFVHDKSSENHRSLHRALSNLTDSIKIITPETTEEIGTRGFTLLDDSIREYSSFIDPLYAAYQREQEVIKTVRDEGEKLEKVVTKKIVARELTPNFVLKLRLLEKNYMLYKDRKSYLELSSGLSQIKNLVPYCFDCVPYTEAINKLFSVYMENDAIENDLQLKGLEMEDISGKIALRERQKINSFIDRTQNLLLAALALLFILGPLFVYRTSAFIVAPIKRLAEITGRISKGDITLRAPLKEHDETYSLAVSFNTMLDHLEKTQHSLKESLELLNEKQAQLVESEKRASLGFLVAGVAHELNNPLNNISLSSAAMSEDLEELTYEEMKDYIKDIIIQSERAHNIVENLLDFARVRKSTIMEKHDIVKVVSDSINLVANQLRVNEINLIKDIPEASYYVKGNRSKLEQILISLITNAVQAMKDAGTLSIGVNPGHDNNVILINVSDTGQGIPEADIKNIFEPFFTTKPSGEGTGLGLSISKTLVAEHNGEIDVESMLGKGTTFTVKLPLYEEPA